MKVDADGIGQAQMANAADGGGESTDRAAPESQVIFGEGVVAEDTPGPADDGVGVDVRLVRQMKIIDEALAEGVDGGEVVDAEGVGGAERGADGRDGCALFEL